MGDRKQDLIKPDRSLIYNLLFDLYDRRGLRQAWESIDVEIQDEIKEVWEYFIDELTIPRSEIEGLIGDYKIILKMSANEFRRDLTSPTRLRYLLGQIRSVSRAIKDLKSILKGGG